MFGGKFSKRLSKEKTEEELENRYNNIELEKNDLLAMLIAAFITFAPLVIVTSLIYVAIAMFFGL